MIKEIIENIDVDLKKAIFDNYILKNGLYVKLGDEPEYFIYKSNKKEEPSLGLKDLEGNIKSNEYEWFVKRDYLSNYLNSNKSIDPPKKKIHNNNYLTLFVKAKEFIPQNRDYFIEKLYEALRDFKNFKKKEEKTVIESFKNYIFDENRQKDIEAKKEKFLKFFDDVLEKKLLIKENEYIRIFFDDDLEKYKKESEIYFALKIFNKIETVRIIENEIYGLSDFNMGLNSKKPYLEHKTRGFSLPFLVKKDEVFEIKEFFDFLKQYKSYEIINEPRKDKSGVYVVKHSNNDQAEIINFDILVLGNELKKPFVYKNYLSIKKDGQIIKDRKIFKKDEFFMFLDEVLYNGQLKNNQYGDVYSKLPNRFQQLIYITRDIVKNIQKGYVELKALNKFSIDFVEFYLRTGNVYKAMEVMNFYFSVKEYEGESMNILQTLDEIEDKVLSLKELSEDEFFILAGQVIMYLLQKSEKKDKKADMIEPFLRAGKSKKLKQEIEALYFKYKHAIPLNFQKLNNAIALLMAFDKDIKLKDYKDKLLLGLLSENIFYRKDEK